MDNQRNLLLAVALSGLLILGWDFFMRAFYPQPETPPQTEQTQAATTATGTPSGAPATAASGEIDAAAAPPAGPVKLDEALSDRQSVAIDTPRIGGSINLANGRIDDIVLKQYREEVDKDADPVRLFAPERTSGQYFAEFGFLNGGKRISDATPWEADGETLTMDTPVTLTRSGAGGLTYTIKLSIDGEYMITAQQTVSNGGEAAAIIEPFAFLNRTSRNATPDEVIVHSGPIGVFDEVVQDPHAYHELAELERWAPGGEPEWLGFSDRYWLGALVPDNSAEGANAAGSFRSLGNDLFRADVRYQAVTLPAGESITRSTRLFAGAKESALLDGYEDNGITLFGKAISWGWFEIIEKPLLWLLTTLNSLIGNFGVAIIALTFIVRAAVFPIAQKGFASMASMKAIQPKMKALQERYKDDKQKQQQEIMKLYKEEKVNPLAGCLPLLIQIPIFFALYKVLILSIEMRHEPFIPFWIQDLSAPDPWTILNLFGLLPFEATGILGIGVLAVLLGVTMWLTFKLNPSAMDPMQQQIFNFMPWVLMFIMAPFAAGLLLYWVTSNILTLAQQKYLYSQHPQLRAQAEKDKAEMAKKAAREKAEKAGAKGGD